MRKSLVFRVVLLVLAVSSTVVAAQRGSHRAGIVAKALDGRMLALQVALDRAGFSPGEIDGRNGKNTTAALAAFQAAAGMPENDASHEGTLAALKVGMEDPLTTYVVSAEDVAGPFIGAMPHDIMEQAKLPALGYTSPLEALAERFHSSQDLIRRLNPNASFGAGEKLSVPNVQPFVWIRGSDPVGAKPAVAAGGKAAAVEILISGATHSLMVRDTAGKTLMYAPVTSGSAKDPLPEGEWKVVGIFEHPTFNYNPDLFWDANPSHAKAKIAPGPNNPVGVVWIDINKEHFGLHGTAEPSTVGRTQSHGCVRLTNWDALKLARLVRVGTKVVIK